MHLFDALNEHGEARRPIYNDFRQNDYIYAQFVCTYDGKLFWFEWADTERPIRNLTGDEIHRYVMGYDDWNLV